VTVASHLRAICEAFGLDALYCFGSRAMEVAAVVAEEGRLDPTNRSDVDLGVLLVPGRRLDARDRARLTMALEDMLEAPRVDLVVVSEASPFLALEVIRGETLYARDRDRVAEFELYVLRRAGDLARFERERWDLLLAGGWG
jgi:predicted nucleotidyltransferase